MDIHGGDRPRKFRAESFASITPSAVPWLVKGVLPARGVGFLAGASKAGKSFLAMDMALRIATGQSVLDRKTRRAGVAYVAAEDPDGCRLRVAAWRRRYQGAPDVPFGLIGAPVNLLAEDDCAALAAELAGCAVEYRETHGVNLGLVVVDTLSLCLPGADENNSESMSRAVSRLQALAADLGCLVLVVAHFGKSGAERGIRGWGGQDANSDATLTLEREEDDATVRTVTLAKVKNGRDGARFSFTLADAESGMVDEDGDPMTSCVVEMLDQPYAAVAGPKRLSPNDEAVLRAIGLEIDSGRVRDLPPGIKGKSWQKAVERGAVLTRMAGSNFEASGPNPAARLAKSLMALETAGRVVCSGELVWLT